MDRSFLGQSFQVQCSIIEKVSTLTYLVKIKVLSMVHSLQNLKHLHAAKKDLG